MRASVRQFEGSYPIEQLRCCCKEAVPELMRAYRAKLLRMIAFRLDSRLLGKVDGEDVLQDVFVEAVRRIPRYLEQPDVPIFVWLRQLTHQALIDTHRRFLGSRMRDVDREVDLGWGGVGDGGSSLRSIQLADSLTTPSQYAMREESAAAVRELLDKLDPIDREVLVLRHLEELSNKEVAEVLGIDKYAASKRYLRALARLRTLMRVESHV